MNAKDEFLETINDFHILCAIVIDIERDYDEDTDEELEPKTIAELKVGFTMEQFVEFLNKLDFEYDKGYGAQRLEGTIWCTDGTWFDRREYDGLEWWELQQYPDITITLKQ